MLVGVYNSTLRAEFISIDLNSDYSTCRNYVSFCKNSLRGRHLFLCISNRIEKTANIFPCGLHIINKILVM